MRAFASVLLVLSLLVPVPALAGEAGPSKKPKKGTKWTAILATAGVGAGFALGSLAGLSVYDDAIDSDRKVWTAATVGAVGGGIAGGLIGWRMDKSKARNARDGGRDLIRMAVTEPSDACLEEAQDPGGAVPLVSYFGPAHLEGQSP